MAEFSLPKNSKITKGKHFAAKDAKNTRTFKIYRWSPDDDQNPRTDTYEHLLQLIVYTDTGAFMRRLDDGTNTADKKPGNMYKYLGETDAERAANLKVIKAWVGEGAWNLNRWAKRGEVPAITKEQLDKLLLKY